jgi:hypothetical protein
VNQHALEIIFHLWRKETQILVCLLAIVVLHGQKVDQVLVAPNVVRDVNAICSNVRVRELLKLRNKHWGCDVRLTTQSSVDHLHNLVNIVHHLQHCVRQAVGHTCDELLQGHADIQ